RLDHNHQIAMPDATVEIIERNATAIAQSTDQVADLWPALTRPARDQHRAGLLGALDEALDVDRVGLAWTEQVARHSGALAVPGDEDGRPRHVVEPAAFGMTDARPVVLDALRRLAFLDAERLLAGRRVG